jgi:hypothetical protein
MPTPTYTALANITLGSSASSVTFSSIPATYRDLVVVVDGTISAGGGELVFVNFNGDTTSGNYSAVTAVGDGSAASSGTSPRRFGLHYPARSSTIASIMDYSATDKHKTYLSRSGSAANALEMDAGRWANTAAITSVKILVDANAFASGTSFALYGIAS